MYLKSGYGNCFDLYSNVMVPKLKIKRNQLTNNLVINNNNNVQCLKNERKFQHFYIEDVVSLPKRGLFSNTSFMTNGLIEILNLRSFNVSNCFEERVLE